MDRHCYSLKLQRVRGNKKETDYGVWKCHGSYLTSAICFPQFQSWINKINLRTPLRVRVVVWWSHVSSPGVALQTRSQVLVADLTHLLHSLTPFLLRPCQTRKKSELQSQVDEMQKYPFKKNKDFRHKIRKYNKNCKSLWLNESVCYDNFILTWISPDSATDLLTDQIQ